MPSVIIGSLLSLGTGALIGGGIYLLTSNLGAAISFGLGVFIFSFWMTILLSEIRE